MTFNTTEEHTPTQITATASGVQSGSVTVYSELTGTQAITGVTAPAKSAEPDTEITAPAGVATEVKWYQGATNTEQTEAFAASSDYTCKITVTPAANYTFASDIGFTVDGVNWAKTGSGNSYMLSKTFTTPAKTAYAGTQASVPTVSNKAGSAVTLTANAAIGSETVEYAYGATSSAATSAWQTATAFTGIPAGERYFFARVKENDDHLAGEAAVSAQVTVYAAPQITGYSGALDNLAIGTAITEITPVKNVPAGLNASDPYTMTGTLPVGLSFNKATGAISGTPSTYAAAGGSVTVTVTDIEDITSAAYTLNFSAVAKTANTLSSITQADVEYNGGTSLVSPSATTNGNAASFQYKTQDAADDTYTDTAPTAVGAYTVKATSSGHDTIADKSVTANFSITPKTLTNLTFTGVTVTKVYDGTTSAGTVGGTAISFDGKVGTDDVSVTATAGAYADADKNVGTSKTVTLTLALAGEKKGNYKLASYTNSFTTAAITAASLFGDTTVTTQNVVKGIGNFRNPSFPGINGEAVTGTVTYGYDGATTYDGVVNKLKVLAAGATGSINYTFTASGNYTGTKTGTIAFTIVDIAFSVGANPASESNAVTEKANPIYGDTWAQIVTIKSSAITAKVGDTPVTGTYSLNVSGSPDAGNQTYKVLFTGGAYTNVEVCSGTVNVGQKTVTVAAGTYKVSKIFDGTVAAGTGAGALSVTGILAADTAVTVTATPAAYSSPNVGGQSAVNVTLALSGTGAGNYQLASSTPLSVPCSIAKATLNAAGTASAAADYGTKLKDIPISGLTAKLNGSPVTGTWRFSGEIVLNAGNTTAYTATFAPSGGSGNYNALTQDVTPTINKILYPGTKDGVSSAKYGTSGSLDLSTLGLPTGYAFGTVTKTDANSVLSGTPTVIGATLSYTFANTAANAGKTATVLIPVTSTNYTDYNITVTATVLDKTAQSNFKFAAATQAKTYGADSTFTAAATGAVTGSTVSYTSGTPTVATVNAASGQVTIVAPGTSLITAAATATDDYAAASVSYTLTVSKGAITVKALNRGIYVNSTAPSLAAPAPNTDYTVTGLAGIDTLGGTIAMKYQKGGVDATPVTTAVGSYDIVISGAANPDTDKYSSIVFTSGILTISSQPSGGGGVSSYTLTFDVNGGSAISAVSKTYGTTVDLAGYKPTKTGYSFGGWYSDSKLTTAVTSVKLTKNTTVYAKWTEQKSELPFTDIPEDAYYKDAVEWAFGKEITGGTTATTFGPAMDCTRGQVVTFLWRAMGKPSASASSFGDVDAGAYYADAVNWAAEKAITGGTGNNNFSPDATVTRGQFVTFLWRAASSPAVAGSGSFPDVSSSAYYAQAIAWAAEQGITLGSGNGMFSPDAPCSRGQIVTFLFRYLGK